MTALISALLILVIANVISMAVIHVIRKHSNKTIKDIVSDCVSLEYGVLGGFVSIALLADIMVLIFVFLLTSSYFVANLINETL